MTILILFSFTHDSKSTTFHLWQPHLFSVTDNLDLKLTLLICFTNLFPPDSLPLGWFSALLKHVGVSFLQKVFTQCHLPFHPPPTQILLLLTSYSCPCPFPRQGFFQATFSHTHTHTHVLFIFTKLLLDFTHLSNCHSRFSYCLSDQNPWASCLIPSNLRLG